jgi:AraC family transcriptional regulator of adaptative response / DNA-3-methyladenine glycosylase II
MERVEGLVYARTFAHKGAVGIIRIAAAPRGLDLTVSDELAPHLRLIIARVRRAFDLDSDVDAIDAALARGGGLLAHDVAARPGIRLTGGLDPFEIVLRAVLGQQVTQPAGRLLAEKAVRAFGAPFATTDEAAGLDRLAPGAAAIASLPEESIAALGMPRARAAALKRAAAAFAQEETATALEAVPGIGPWTRAYVRLRGFADPDAAPPGDAALTRAGYAECPADLSPWRGYAALRLWTAKKPGEAPCPATPI